MDIVSKLNDWKVKNNGEVITYSTITIKSNTLNITVTGKDLEDAYNQIEAVCAKKDEQVTPAPTFPQATKPIAPIQSSTPKSIEEALNGRQLLRMYNHEPLGDGEELLNFGGMTYVVKR